MSLSTLSIVITCRHNMQLAGDFALAEREFRALTGASCQWLETSEDVARVLGNARAARIVHSAPDPPPGTGVAVVLPGASPAALARLLARSAFAQELIATGPSGGLCGLADQLSTPRSLVPHMDGMTLVSIAMGYLIESEQVLPPDHVRDRLAATAELLLAPFTASGPSSLSRRVRSAKKTTLALSHDLHVYKAKFFPRMVRALLNIFAKDGDVVVDPFVGSGTLLLEGSLLGLATHGVDIDPMCVRMSRSKVAPFLDPEAAKDTLVQFRRILSAGPAGASAPHLPEELEDKLLRRDRRDGTNYADEIRRDVSTIRTALAARTVCRFRELVETLASDAVTKKVRFRFIGIGNGRYTIEILKGSIMDRLTQKLQRAEALASVFTALKERLGQPILIPTVVEGDARVSDRWGLDEADLIITSPPYLPASSGREHYAPSRALSFSVVGEDISGVGYQEADLGVVTADREDADCLLASCAEARALMEYLNSDFDPDADPQRDAMRAIRKAPPTMKYLLDMRDFFRAARKVLAPEGRLLLVVARQHTFYSHRRGIVEHVVRGDALYGEIASMCGFRVDETIEMELAKSAVSRARPRAKDAYSEVVLVLGPTGRTSVAV